MKHVYRIIGVVVVLVVLAAALIYFLNEKGVTHIDLKIFADIISTVP